MPMKFATVPEGFVTNSPPQLTLSLGVCSSTPLIPELVTTLSPKEGHRLVRSDDFVSYLVEVLLYQRLADQHPLKVDLAPRDAEALVQTLLIVGVLRVRLCRKLRRHLQPAIERLDRLNGWERLMQRSAFRGSPPRLICQH